MDVIVIHSSEKRTAADRLRKAIVREGYSVETDIEQSHGQSAAQAVAEKLGEARAVVVLWSKAALTAPLVTYAADLARAQGKLIEASADGIKPIGTPDAEMRTALLSGWRGEPFQPGWQKVLRELGRICGGRGDAARDMGKAVPGAGEGRPPAGRAARLAIASFLLLFVTAAAAWIAVQRSSAPGSASQLPQSEAPAPRHAAGSATGEFQSPSPHQDTQSRSQPLPESPVALNDRPVERPEGTSIAGTVRQQPDVQRKQSRKGETANLSPSTTMRLFCERSGRGTPECRTFLGRIGRENTMPRQQQSLREAASPKASPDAKAFKNSENMRLFCKGAGRRTPECRAFRRSGSRN